jgi:glycerol-3-phosphate dehydrogenase
MAEDAINKLLEISPELRAKASPCITLKVPLIGAHGYSSTLPILLAQQYGFTKSVCTHLVNTYGGKAYEVCDLAMQYEKKQQWPLVGNRIVNGYPYLEAEVRYSVREEYCRTVTDVLAHRTRLAYLNVNSAREAIPKVASIMREELSWDGNKELEEVKLYTIVDCFKNYYLHQKPT